MSGGSISSDQGGHIGGMEHRLRSTEKGTIRERAAGAGASGALMDCEAAPREECRVGPPHWTHDKLAKGRLPKKKTIIYPPLVDKGFTPPPYPPPSKLV